MWSKVSQYSYNVSPVWHGFSVIQGYRKMTTGWPKFIQNMKLLQLGISTQVSLWDWVLYVYTWMTDTQKTTIHILWRHYNVNETNRKTEEFTRIQSFVFIASRWHLKVYQYTVAQLSTVYIQHNKLSVLLFIRLVSDLIISNPAGATPGRI